MAVNLTFNGDSADAQAAIAKLERQYAGLENKLKQVGKASKAAGEEGSAAFTSFAQQITGVNSFIDIAAKGMQLLKTNYADFLEMQDKAKGANVGFGKVFSEAVLNAGAGVDPKQLKERLLNIAQKAEIMPEAAAEILNIAQSTKGDLGDDVVDKTIFASSRLARLSPESNKQLIGAALELQKRLPGTTPEQALGFTLNLGAEGRPESAREFAQNIAPGVSSIAQMEKTGPEYAAAVANALSSSASDASGRKTRTALLALDLQLAKALPDLNTLQERVGYMQDNPAFAKAFFEGGEHKGKRLAMDFQAQGPGGEQFAFTGNHASFERQFEPSMRLLADKNSVISKEVDRIFGAMPSLKNSTDTFNLRVRGIENDANFQVAGNENRLAVNTEVNNLKNVKGARDSTVRKSLDDMLQSEGFDWFQRNQMSWEAWGQTVGTGKTREEATLEIMRNRAKGSATARAGDGGAMSEATAAEIREAGMKYEKIVGLFEGQKKNEEDEIQGGAEAGAAAGGVLEAIKEQTRIMQEQKRGALVRNGNREAP